MARRYPLAEKVNTQGPGNPHRPPGDPGKARKRACFRVLDKPTLKTQLNLILKTEGSQALTEDDLQKASPDKVHMIYFHLLNYSFEVTADSFRQVPFEKTCSIVHQELMDDFIYRIQFFRAMKRLMYTCQTDFKIEDLMNPDSKRLCRHLSAFLNYIKFHHYVFNGDDTIHQKVEEKERLEEEYVKEGRINVEVQQEFSDLQKQRIEERVAEEELKAKIVEQEQRVHECKLEEEVLNQHFMSESEAKKSSDQKLAGLSRELEKCSLRVEDLAKKVVSSPDKLKAKLACLQQQVIEAIAASKETESLQMMWESLGSQGPQIPGGVIFKALSENLDTLTVKAEKRNEVAVQCEGLQETCSQQNQVLQELTHQYQNLHQRLRFMEDDACREACQLESKTSHSRLQELHRDVGLLQQEVKGREIKREEFERKIGEEKRKVAENGVMMKQIYTEMEEITNALVSAFHEKADEYEQLLLLHSVQ